MNDDTDAPLDGRPTQRLDNNGQDSLQEQATQRFRDPAPAFYVGDGIAVAPGPIQSACPDCGGELIWAMAKAGNAPLRTVSLSGPGLLNQHMSDVAAVVCANCGLTKFYTLKPDKVRER